MQVLTILLALAAPTAASKKHEGKDHLHPAQRRQVQGLGVLASPAPATAIVTTPSVTPTISSYVFPSTVIQEPVATVCPDTPASSAIFSILPVSSLVFAAESSNATRALTNHTTRYIPIQVNATALLPNGSTTVFLSATTTAPRPPFSASPEAISSHTGDDTTGAAATARIILDSNGCQTVYSARTTTWCSTTVKPAGMIAVSVTDCDQWITFSSQRLDACSTEAAAAAAPTVPGLGDDAAAADGRPPMAYYLAHWYDLVQGAIPNRVQVQNCLPGSTAWDCATSSESWDVVTSTTTRTGTTVASFAGPAVMTVGASTLTTTLSFETTRTTTAVITSSTIARHQLGGDVAGSGGSSSEQTVTVLVTMPTTRTLSLDSVTRTTVTVRQTSTLHVTETRTRTQGPAQIERVLDGHAHARALARALAARRRSHPRGPQRLQLPRHALDNRRDTQARVDDEAKAHAPGLFDGTLGRDAAGDEIQQHGRVGADASAHVDHLGFRLQCLREHDVDADADGLL
ncbi:hypothetical protein CLCR_09802 [Cladophialophora carrionii]|uniref:Uncharacterized protein n=1 Tax=Cladophialophora carrionii TaxID=86049 RepID=A0A1C1CZB0_9EURO|nr:hypothetical protein CLCR_09802 [Cladophialophora carrionii]